MVEDSLALKPEPRALPLAREVPRVWALLVLERVGARLGARPESGCPRELLHVEPGLPDGCRLPRS